MFRIRRLVIALALLVVIAALVRNDAPAPAAAKQDPRCPQAIAPEVRPAPRILRVLRAEAKRFGEPERMQGYRVSAVFPLAQDHFVPGLRRSRYLDVARKACGEDVARRSWVVVIHQPAAAAVDLGLIALYFARTVDGWTAWHGWLPNARTTAFPGE